MVGWHHQVDGHESEQTPGDSEGQGSLTPCSPWGCKESDMTQQLNNVPPPPILLSVTRSSFLTHSPTDVILCLHTFDGSSFPTEQSSGREHVSSPPLHERPLSSEPSQSGLSIFFSSWLMESYPSLRLNSRTTSFPKSPLIDSIHNVLSFGTKTEQDPEGPSWYKSFLCPHFLFVGNRLHSASLAFLSSKGQRLILKKGKEYRNKGRGIRKQR